MEIQFQTLKIIGFAGIQPLTIVKLDDPGLTVITGPNGATKTTRFSALVWCIYGIPLKEKSTVETWEHVRTDDYQGTKVAVSFFRGGKKYKVTRCKQYDGLVNKAKGGNRLIVERDGELLWPRLKDKRDIQKALIDLMGFSYNLFINSIVFPQKVKRFIENKGPERKVLLEESFKMLWINAAGKIAREKQKVIKDARLLVAAEQRGHETALKSLGDMITTMEAAEEEFGINKQKNLSAIRLDIATLEAQSTKQAESVAPILERERDLLRDKDTLNNTQLYKDRSKLTIDLSLKLDKKGQYLKGIKALKRKLVSAESTEEITCGECYQVIPRDTSKEYIADIQKDIGKEEKSLRRLSVKIRPIQEDVIKANTLAQEYTDAESDLSSIATELKEARETNLLIEGTKGRLEEMNKQKVILEDSEYKDVSAPVKGKIYTTEQALKKVNKKLSGLDRQIDTYDWVIATPLGPNGIKAFMFTRLVELVNYQLAQLEKATSFGVVLSVEGSGVRKNIEAIVSRRGFPVGYPDLSGGEGNLVNVMISLAIGEVVTVDQPINIRIFDESFEGLDEGNVEVVANLLSQIKVGASIFVITHKTSFNPQNCNRIILSNDD